MKRDTANNKASFNQRPASEEKLTQPTMILPSILCCSAKNSILNAVWLMSKLQVHDKTQW